MTERIIHDLAQGSEEWAQFRLTHFGASEAGAMLGVSTKIKRTELLHMKVVGTAKEFSEFVQTRILDKGHEVEAMARPSLKRCSAKNSIRSPARSASCPLRATA